MSRLRSEARSWSWSLVEAWLSQSSWSDHPGGRSGGLGAGSGEDGSTHIGHGQDGLTELLTQGNGASRLLETQQHGGQTLHWQRLLGNTFLLQWSRSSDAGNLPLQELDGGGHEYLSVFSNLVSKPLLQVLVFSSAGEDGKIYDKWEGLTIQHHVDRFQVLSYVQYPRES